MERTIVRRHLENAENEAISGIPSGGTVGASTDSVSPDVPKGGVPWSKGRPSAASQQKKAAGLVAALRRRDPPQSKQTDGAFLRSGGD